jgi:hypothetical protein
MSSLTSTGSMASSSGPAEFISPTAALAMSNPALMIRKDDLLSSLVSPSATKRMSHEDLRQAYTQLFSAHAAAISQIRHLQGQPLGSGRTGEGWTPGRGIDLLNLSQATDTSAGHGTRRANGHAGGTHAGDGYRTPELTQSDRKAASPAGSVSWLSQLGGFQSGIGADGPTDPARETDKEGRFAKQGHAHYGQVWQYLALVATVMAVGVAMAVLTRWLWAERGQCAESRQRRAPEAPHSALADGDLINSIVENVLQRLKENGS